MKFNASMLKTWQSCPLQAKFKYIDGLPDKSSAYAIYGVCIHDALEYYLNTLDVEGSVSRFYRTWENPGLLGREKVDYWPTRTSYGGMRESGAKLIREYDMKNKWDERKLVVTEHRFCVPFGRHMISGIVDFIEFKKDYKGRKVLKISDFKSGKQPYKTQLLFDIQFCADRETEILTKRGWKSFNEVIIGEDVLTLNQETGLSEWQPASDVCTFQAKDQELISLEGKAHSSLTTKNHRWPVSHIVSGQNGWRKEDRIVVSEDLTGADRITCAARVGNLPTSKKHSDDMVELVAWFAAEGHVVRGGSLSLAQSEKVNPDYVSRIENCLSSLFSRRNSLRNGRKSLPFGAWRVARNADCNRYYLNREASLEVSEWFSDLDNKVVDCNRISELTEDQLRLFVDTFMAADGHGYVLTQAYKPRLYPVQMAYSLLGVRTSLRNETVKGGRYDGREFFSLSVKEKEPTFTPRKDTRSVELYTGTVWCPVTKNSTWFARRRGQVYFTGNTIYAYASMQPEFWMGFDDEYPGMDDGELLYNTFAGMPRLPYWVNLVSGKEIMAGERDMNDFLRLHRLCDEVEKAIDREVFMPTISGDSCYWCPYSDDCFAVDDVRDKLLVD